MRHPKVSEEMEFYDGQRGPVRAVITRILTNEHVDADVYDHGHVDHYQKMSILGLHRTEKGQPYLAFPPSLTRAEVNSAMARHNAQQYAMFGQQVGGLVEKDTAQHLHNARNIIHGQHALSEENQAKYDRESDRILGRKIEGAAQAIDGLALGRDIRFQYDIPERRNPTRSPNETIDNHIAQLNILIELLKEMKK